MTLSIEGHTSVVGDVAWHQHNPKLFGSVGDDKQLLFWDTSMDGSKPTTVVSEVIETLARPGWGRGVSGRDRRTRENGYMCIHVYTAVQFILVDRCAISGQVCNLF